MTVRVGGSLALVAAFAMPLSPWIALASEPSVGSGLRFERVEHRFGSVDQGVSVSADFPFENAGQVPLTMSPPVVGCGCEAEVIGPSDLLPGQSGLVRFACDTSLTTGSVRRTATIHSSDVERRAVVLTMSGEVRLDVLADPSEVYLGKVMRGGRKRSAFSIALGSSGGRRVKLGGASTPGPYIDVRPDKSGVSFDVLVDPKAPLGRFTQEVSVATSSERFPDIVVSVTGFVVEDLPTKRW